MRSDTDSIVAVEMNNISKSFGGIKALDNVDISSLPILNNYTKYISQSRDNDQLTYYISDPMYMRGVRIVQVAVSPYQYSQNNREVVLYDEIDLTINIENTENYIESPNSKPLSNDFNIIISSLVDNYEYESRNNDIKSCILFICGGNSLDHSSVQDLIQWRKQLGYEVYTAETSQIGSSTTAIKIYFTSN